VPAVPSPPAQAGSPQPDSGGFKYTPPPKKETGPPSSEKRAAELFKQFPQWKKYWANVKNAAYRYKVDPIELLSLFIFENGRANPTAKSSAGALGLAQIHDTTVRRDLNPAQYDTFIAEWANGDPRITDQMKANPAFSIAYAAWRMGGSRGKYASLDEWYRSPGYNPGFKGDSRGPGPSIYAGKYQASVPQTPTQTAAGSVDVAGQKDALTANWAVRTKDGVRFVASPEPPKNTVLWHGQPVDQSGFLKAKQYYNDIYQGYVGKNAPDAAIAHILNSGLSDTGLMIRLSKSPNFKKGTIYQGRAAGLVLRAKQVFGENWKADDDLIRRAIVQSWDEATYVAKLRARPEYLKGPEFKKDEAALLNVHMSIMGRPDAAASTEIKKAVLGGWSADQYAAYVRGSKAYVYSPEYQTKALQFAEAMGLFTGKQPTLQPGAAPANPNPVLSAPPPDSKRIPGAPGLTPNDNLVVR
jgi:hypothetical protein